MEASKKDMVQVSRKDWQEEAVLDHLNCCLCGTELKFEHKIDHIRMMVIEDAYCSCCGVKHRANQYRLQ